MELAAGFDHLAQLETVLAHLALDIAPIPRPGLFLAGKAYRDYRRRGGVRTGVLPDFFSGAHAAVEGAQLLTRDAARIRTYLPTVSLLTPHPL